MISDENKQNKAVSGPGTPFSEMDRMSPQPFLQVQPDPFVTLSTAGALQGGAVSVELTLVLAILGPSWFHMISAFSCTLFLRDEWEWGWEWGEASGSQAACRALHFPFPQIS